MSLMDHLALAQAKYLKKPVLWAVRNTALLRMMFTATVRMQTFVPRGITQARIDLNGVSALKVGSGPGAVLCLHGGGFAIGSSASHAPMAGHLARALGRPVYVPDYRLVPEHPFPAAIDDCVAAYRALLTTHAPEAIALTGDSAGGALCLSLLHACALHGLPIPGAMVLMSPAADFRAAARTALLAGPGDPLLSKRWALQAIAAYIGAHPDDDPLLSPLAAPLPAAPPTLIHYAQDEALTPQILAAADAVRATGATAALKAFTTAYHSFQIDGTPNARRSIAETAEFMAKHLK